MAYPPHGSFPGVSPIYPPYHDPAQQYHRPVPPGPPPLTIPPQPPHQQSYHQYNMSASSIVPASPSQESDASEEKYRNLPGITPISRIHEGKGYLLEVKQQPMRARMCGFGDKDRRPISPPPCILLRIFDADTGKDISYTPIENLSRFVLLVDLVQPDNLDERNVVKHPSTSPSISTVQTSSYPHTTATSATQILADFNVAAHVPGYANQNYAQSPSQHRASDRGYQTNGTAPQQYYGNGMSQYNQAPPIPQGPYATRYHPQYPPHNSGLGHMTPESRGSVDYVRSSQTGTCTRNLIGSLSGSAFKLKDLNGDDGLWFVFQDLSIRTEGYFRLKFSFFDLMSESVSLEAEATTANLTRSAPLLACSYSDVFHVYSAKKFPGVIESTPLSRHFAKQGIKIPIRKDGARDGDKRSKRRRDDDSDGDLSDEDDLA